MRGWRGAASCVALASVAALTAGCGSSGGGSLAAAGPPQPHGTMTIAVPSRPERLDPLLATTPVDRLVAAQLFEPLVQHLSGPYDDFRRLPGVARSVRPGDGDRLWRIQLRPGVRFQDGRPLDASAVVANAHRWLTSAVGRRLLPGLTAADAPRPDLARLIFDRAEPDVAHRLASGELAIVAPSALRPRSGTAAAFLGPAGAGTGAFELRRGPGRTLVLARNSGWWGTRHGLGPALDQVELRVEPDAGERLRLLRRGDVQAAWSLPPSLAANADGDPLLTSAAVPGDGSIGLERSVRGIGSADGSALLSSVWLTNIGAG